MLNFKCVKCGELLNVPDGHKGNMVKCSQCGISNRIYQPEKKTGASMERTVESELSGETQMREDDSECTMPGETVALIGDAVVVLLCFVASCVVFVVFYYAYKTTASFIMATIASLIACVSVLVWALLIKYFVSILQCLHILIDLQIQTQEKNED